MSEKIIKREDFIKEGANIQEVQTALEAEALAFAEEINAIDSLDELKKREDDLMEVAKEDDEHLKTVKYELPDEITSLGDKFKKGDIIKMIISFLNRIECNFQTTLGIWQGIDFWKKLSDNLIPYGVFDSTLRLLGQLKFKGEKDCHDVLVVNDWFSSAHQAYLKDLVWTRYIATLHNIITQRMQEREKELTPDGVVINE